MSDDRIGRRRVIAASLGVLVVGSAAACEPSSAAPAAAAGPTGQLTGLTNVRDFGAKGDGNTDDTAAFASAVAKAPGPIALYLPAGTYRLTAFPQLASYSTVTGDGPDLSIVQYGGDGTLLVLTDKQRIALRSIGLWVTSAKGTAVSVTGSFRCSFDTVVIRGTHAGQNYPKYKDQRGVILDGNSGGTTFLNCDINNFGVGLTTKCIQNYVTATKFSTNRIGILGTGDDNSAGLSVMNSEFVSDLDPNTTDAHIQIDGKANDWWLTNVWFEGCDTALRVGSGSGGPMQLSLVNAKVAARKVGIDLVRCRQPYLANIIIDADPGSSPTGIKIDSKGCPSGTATNLTAGEGPVPAVADFPAGWIVSGGDGERSGDVVTTRSVLEGGAVLRSPNGHYWDLQIADDGAVTAKDLGSQRPN